MNNTSETVYGIKKPKEELYVNKENVVEDINLWFVKAYPNPTFENACVQIGVHYEEVSEMMEVLQDDTHLINDLVGVSQLYKAKNKSYLSELTNLDDDEKVELLDSLCDQIVTAIGSANFMGFDIIGALAEVNRSNWSKFENGEAIYNEQGKIMKGENYTKPTLDRFI